LTVIQMGQRVNPPANELGQPTGEQLTAPFGQVRMLYVGRLQTAHETRVRHRRDARPEAGSLRCMRASFIRALARGEMRNPKQRFTASNRFALLRTGRVQADGRQECILKVLLHKHRGMRELVSRRMCLASERVDALEVEIAALGEVG
jgi:hypothetical protein